MHLSHADQTAVLDSLSELYAQTELDPLRELILRLSSRLVANEWASYNEIERDTYRSVLNFRIPDSIEIQARAPSLLACVHEHPGVNLRSATSFQARTMSDYLPWGRFQRTTMYNEYYRHVGVRHQIFFSFDGGRGTRRTIALNRKSSGFSDRDRSILDIMSPHFCQAYATASLLQQTRQTGVLPLEASDRSPSRLTNLTRRENEILGWIARGKSNPEIATILGLSVRTVYKHVEHLFAKMGVETRAQAMVRALETRQ